MSTETRTAPGSVPSAAHDKRLQAPTVARAGATRQEPDWNAAEDLGLLPRRIVGDFEMLDNLAAEIEGRRV